MGARRGKALGWMICGALFLIAMALPRVIWGVWPFVSDRGLTDAEIEQRMAALDLPDFYADIPQVTPEQKTRMRDDFVWCRFCHTLKAGGEHRVGPNLHQIFGKPAAAARNFTYTDAFVEARERGVVWTPETVASFISDPKNYIPHNRMNYKPITDPVERQNIIDYLLIETR